METQAVNSFITLYDVMNEKDIATFDTTNTNGEIMEYYYYYFGGYNNHIRFLMERGAIKVNSLYKYSLNSKSDIKVICIYEIK